MSEDEYIKLVGSNIVARRRQLGIKQIDLAHKTGIEDSLLRRIESGKTNRHSKHFIELRLPWKWISQRFSDLQKASSQGKRTLYL